MPLDCRSLKHDSCPLNIFYGFGYWYYMVCGGVVEREKKIAIIKRKIKKINKK